jgi:hypothetical protein
VICFVFTTWRSFVPEKKHRKVLLSYFTHCLFLKDARSLVGCAFSEWSKRARTLRRASFIAQIFFLRYLKHSLARAFMSWAECICSKLATGPNAQQYTEKMQLFEPTPGCKPKSFAWDEDRLVMVEAMLSKHSHNRYVIHWFFPDLNFLIPHTSCNCSALLDCFRIFQLAALKARLLNLKCLCILNVKSRLIQSSHLRAWRLLVVTHVVIAPCVLATYAFKLCDL